MKPYVKVSDDGPGADDGVVVYIMAPDDAYDGHTRRYTYFTMEGRDRARDDAERYAKRVAKEVGAEWGCNY